MANRNVKDIVSGLLIVAVGLYFLVGALGIRIGTAQAMGPGYFPMLVGSVAIVIGIAIALPAFFTPGSFPETVSWRPMLAVLGGIAAFALTLSRLGLVPAMVIGIALCALGDRSSRLWSTIVLAIIAALGAWLIFRVGLGLQMPAFRRVS